MNVLHVSVMVYFLNPHSKSSLKKLMNQYQKQYRKYRPHINWNINIDFTPQLSIRKEL